MTSRRSVWQPAPSSPPAAAASSPLDHLDCHVPDEECQLESQSVCLPFDALITRQTSCCWSTRILLPGGTLSLLLLLACCLSPTVHGCSISQFQCTPSLECIPLSLKCDGVADCPDRSDEIGCPKKCITEDEFACGDGKCIRMSWKCDGQMDCANNEDEQNCEVTCPGHQFKCFDSKSCIDKSKVCNGHSDCADASDEGSIACLFHVSYCTKGEFNCTNGHCIDASLACNSHDDCGDNSDETTPTCDQKKIDCLDGDDEEDCAFEPKRCEEDQFECHNGLECIKQHWVCDRNADCSDGSDELDCSFCSASEFKCTNQHCVPMSMRCDGEAECSDGSDEFGCEEKSGGGKADVALNVTSDMGDKWTVENRSMVAISPNETDLKTVTDKADKPWWFTPEVLKFEGDKWLLIAAIVLAVLLVAFLAPYALRYLCSFSSSRRRYRWIKLNNLKHSRTAAVRKSVELGGNLLATVSGAAGRRDDLSSGYSSISERLSVQQEVENEALEEDNSDSLDSDEQVYRPPV